MISSLRDSALPIIVASSMAVVPALIAFSIGLLWEKSEGLEEPLTLGAKVSSGLLFEVGQSGLFLLLPEGPWDICSGVKPRGVDNSTGKSLGHATVAQKTVPMFCHFGKIDLEQIK